jgi:hypothetical protein
MQVSFLIIGGTDAGGIRIVPDGHGGYKIVKVPGWNPEQMVELGHLIDVVSAAGRLKHPEVSQAILKAAGKLITSEITPGLEQGAGEQVVVAVVGR